MTILSLPTGVVPNTFEFALKTNTATFTSELNQVEQTSLLQGAKWSTNMTFSNRIGSEARGLMAMLTGLLGSSGRFYVSPYDHLIPDGTALGTPLVKGANQTGSTLLTDGWTANQTNLLKMGDYFQVGTELKMITADCVSDSSGNATLTFSPPLRTSPSDNASIVTTNPKCIMKLTNEDQARWSAMPWTNSSKLYAITIAAIEAIDI